MQAVSDDSFAARHRGAYVLLPTLWGDTGTGRPYYSPSTSNRVRAIESKRRRSAPNSRNVEHCQDTQRRDHQDRSTRIPREPRTNPEGTFAAATGDRFIESSTQASRAQHLRRRTRSTKNSCRAACRGIDEAGQVHAQGNRFDAAAIGTLGRRSREAAVGKRSNDLQLGTWSKQTAARASGEARFAASRWQERATKLPEPVGSVRVMGPNAGRNRIVEIGRRCFGARPSTATCSPRAVSACLGSATPPATACAWTAHRPMPGWSRPSDTCRCPSAGDQRGTTRSVTAPRTGARERPRPASDRSAFMAWFVSNITGSPPGTSG